MPPYVVEMIGALGATFLIGTFIILFPISRRFGRVMEEWIRLRRESTPDRERLERIGSEVQEVRQLLDGLDRRVDLISERQEFTESLLEARRAAALPPEEGA
ncbi:MAG: hypothetical protein ACE5HP_04710 [Gemmatimonadota bacterium]